MWLIENVVIGALTILIKAAIITIAVILLINLCYRKVIDDLF